MVETTNSKVRRKEKEKMEICNSTEDRISQLPDSLILHILSYLDIRYVIQTISLLSKRWKPLWTSLSNLKFSDTDFFSRGTEWISRFIQFVDTVLLLRDSSDIKKFFLSCSYPEWETRKTHIYTWILIAVRRNVQELSIRLPEEFNFHFPPSIFTCTSLTSLFINNFDGDITEHNLNPMNLPKLKILILWGIIVDQNLTNKIFSSCPSLETLIWDFASVKDSDKSFIISAPKLKHLSLQKVQYSMKNEAVTVTLNAPKLTSFSCKDVSEQDYNLDSFDCLETANIEMSLIEQPTDFLHLPLSLRELYAPRLMNFLRAIHNVKDLTISSGCLEVMMGVPDSVHSPPTQFRNLRRLKFDVWLTRASFRAITYLLQISPNIEYLSMEVYGVNIDDEYFYYVDAISRKNLEYWDEGTSLPCILSHLKFVKIQGLVGCVNELKFLNFLLKNSVVLQKLDLFEGYSPKLSVPKRRLKKFKKTLLSFPRASEAANDMIQFKF